MVVLILIETFADRAKELKLKKKYGFENILLNCLLLKMID